MTKKTTKTKPVQKTVKKTASVKKTAPVKKTVAVKKDTVKEESLMVSQNPVAFNKANTLELADQIFSDKNGQINMLKLCRGTLVNGKEGERTLHCAVGEAYFRFVSQNMADLGQPNGSGATRNAINNLVSKALLKDPKDKIRLIDALNRAVSQNDDTTGDTLADHIRRATDVASVFRHQVAPLLQ